MNDIFAAARLRYVIPVVMGGSILPYALLPVEDIDRVTIGTVFLQFLSLAMIYLLLHSIWLSGRKSPEIFGERPELQTAGKFFLLGIPLVGVSLFCFYLLFYPLSFVAPDFVQWWAIETPEFIVPAGRDNALAINLGMVLLLVVAGPVVEELLFRGFLFGRMAAKWGSTAALWVSSLLFAVLHPDTLGALVFALVLCLVRVKYDSLWAPLLIHMGNNLVVALWTGIEVLILGVEYEYTVAEFRSHLWLAPIGGLVGIPWLYRYCMRELRPGCQAAFHA